MDQLICASLSPHALHYRYELGMLKIIVALVVAIKINKKQRYEMLCVCVFSYLLFWTSSSLDVPTGVTQEGHTGFFIHLPSAGACLNFSREKDSAIPFPRRP